MSVTKPYSHIKKTRKKTGYWIPIYPDKNGYTDVFRCSVCKLSVLLHWYSTECNYKYCLHCGAEMEVTGDA